MSSGMDLHVHDLWPLQVTMMTVMMMVVVMVIRIIIIRTAVQYSVEWKELHVSITPG